MRPARLRSGVIVAAMIGAAALALVLGEPASADDPPGGPNLLRNTGFEEWEIRTDTYQTVFGGPPFSQTDTVLMPVHWFAELVFSCCVFPELGNVVSQGAPNSGSFGLRLGGDSGDALQTGIYFFQEVAVVPGLAYVPAYHVKNPFAGARRMRATWLNGQGQAIGGAFFLAAPASAEYTHVQGSAVGAPCNAASIRIYLDKADFGSVTYDDAYFGRSPDTPATACPVKIDIKPGSDPNAINPRSRGLVPVAVLSASGFSAPDLLDSSSFTFAGAAVIRGAGEDVNGDGLADLVLFFRTQETSIACGQTSARLEGHRLDGGLVSGEDAIQTVGC